MRNDDTAAACVPLMGRRILAWALQGPPWTYVALAIAGLAAALLLASLKG